MKYLRNILLFAAAALAFTSCVDKYSYESASKPSGEQIFFPGSVGDQIELAIGDVNFKLPVYRGGKDLEALDVEIAASGEGLDFFTVPGSFSFEEGESQAEITISLIDADSLGLNNFKLLTIAIADSTLATPYGRSKVTFKAGIAPPWNKFDVGVLAEAWWGEEEPDKLMEYQQLNDHLRRCRIKDCWGYETIAAGDDYDVQDYIWYWDTNTDYCYVPLQYMGYTSQYGPTFAADEASFYNWYWVWSKGQPNYGGSGNVEGSDEWFAWHDGRRAAWGAEGDFFPYYNGNGVFYLADQYTAGDPRDPNGYAGRFAAGGDADFFTGKSFKDYTIDVEYAGMHVDVEGVPYPILNFSGNKKTVPTIYYKLVAQGSDPDEAVDSIVAGTDTAIVKVTLSGGKGVSQPLVEPGLYSLVAVPYDPADVEIEQDEEHPLSPEELEAAKAAAKYKTRYAIVYDFYFPGISSEKKEVEATLTVDNIDDVYGSEAAAKGCYRYNSFAFGIKGSEIKSAKYYLNSSAVIATISDYGLTLEEVINAYGTGFDAEDIDDINSNDGLVAYFGNLNAKTAYTIAVYLENIYGSKLVLTEEYTTDAVPYSGELVIGDYMILGSEDTSYVSLAPTATENAFILYDLGIENGAGWNAVYDPEAKTLTLDGTENGYEQYGNSFGVGYDYLDNAHTMFYAIEVYASNESEGNDTLVIDVDPATKQLCKLNADVEVNAYSTSNGSYLGTICALEADSPIKFISAPSPAPARNTQVKKADARHSFKKVSVINHRINSRQAVQAQGKINLAKPAKVARTVNEGWGGKAQKVSVISRSYAVPFTSTR